MIMKSWISKFLITFLLVISSALSASPINLLPDYVSLQSGGGMGIATVGTGWQYGKNRHWETDFHLGLIPKYDSDAAKVVFTLKENYIPWRIGFRHRLTLEPLTTSFYLTTVASHKFWARQPDRYPSKYYCLPTKIRFNISLGQRLTWDLPGKPKTIKSLTAYYEIGTCDIYVLNAFGNSYLTPYDYLTLCLGVRMNF